MTHLSAFSIILRIVLAAVFGGLIGTERSMHGRAAGMRTHLMVCVGSCLTVLVGIYAYLNLGFATTDPLRVAAQVISGIGFLGAGMIIVRGRFEVVGLTTAAGLWATAAMGICLGAGFYLAAIVATGVILFASVAMNIYEKKLVNAKSNSYHIYVEVSDVKKVNKTIDLIRAKYHMNKVDVTAPRSGVSGNVGLEISLVCDWVLNVKEIIDWMNEQKEIIFAVESL